MSKIIYNSEIMKIMSIFESLTGAKLKDCIKDDNLLIFIVQENEIAKAIGKGGANVRKLEEILKKKIKIVEYSSDLLQFIKNLITPIKIKEIKEENGIVTITGNDTKSKGILIGRDSKNLQNTTQIVQRYFDIKQIKVV